MEKYTIKKILNLKTSKGDDYKKVDLMKEDGSVVEGVSAFKFKFPAQDLLVEGGEILAGIVIDGNYKNLISAVEKPKGNSGYKEKVIGEAMTRKEEGIAKSQDNKEWGIKVSSTMNHAVDLAIAEFKDKTVLDTLDQAVLKWRRFLWDNWDVDVKDTDAITGKML